MNIKKKYLVLSISFIIYTSLSILIKPDSLLNYDFLVPWYAALYITKGIPLYNQPEHKIIDGQSVAFPYHLPIYIYFLAVLIWAFGENFIASKVSLTVFIFCDALLLEEIFKENLAEEQKRKKIWDYTSLIFLLNPITFITTVAGLFDGLPLLFFLIGFYFLQKTIKENSRKNLVNSFIIGAAVSLGFLTKIIPILLAPVVFLALLFNKKYYENLTFSITFLTLTGVMLVYLFIVYPNIKYFGFGWQMRRGANSFSPYYYLFDLKFLFDLIWVGIGMFILSSFFSWELIKKKNVNLFIYSGVYLLVFLILYRVFYPHYLLWLVPYLTFIGMKYVSQKQYIQVISLGGILVVEAFPILIWYLDFFKVINFSDSLLLGLSIINMMILIIYLIYLLKLRKIEKKTIHIKVI
ncbi:MAG: hypothetical protein ACTSUR_02505 [Candidatus Heimdallarchaeaceae archaeon]